LVLPFIDSLEIPNIFKIKLRKIEKKEIEKIVEKIKTIEQTPLKQQILNINPGLSTAHIIATVKDPIVKLSIIANRDPEMALIGFRIEIEKRILDLAETFYHNDSKQKLGQLIKRMIKEAVIPNDVADGLIDLILLGEKARRGRKVSKQAIDYTLKEGPYILTILDSLIEINRRKDEP